MAKPGADTSLIKSTGGMRLVVPMGRVFGSPIANLSYLAHADHVQRFATIS